MEQYWCAPTPRDNDDPMYVLLDVSGGFDRRGELEQQTGALDEDALLAQVFACLQHDESAQLELEYLYLHLAADHVQCSHYPDVERVLDFMIELGERLLAELRFHKVYNDGSLFYDYCRRAGSAVLLKRRDLLRAQLTRELAETEPRADPAVCYPRYTGGAPDISPVECAYHAGHYRAGDTGL